VLKHIIFDCDGVLWEGTNEGYVRCYHRAAVEAGIELDYAVARERIVANWGRSARHEIEGMIPEHPELVGEVVRRYRRLVRSDLFLSAAVLIPGVRETLQSLFERFPLSAITGMNADNLATLLARFELRSYLRHALSTGDNDDPARQKHTGYHLRQLLEWEAVAPDEVLCVGDAPVDVQMAEQVGAPVVVVLSGHLDQRQASQLGARAVLGTVAELPEWIERTYPRGQ
jgi:phosphoglycolate phosphatase-like HAD superfamily hydrolase